MRVRLLALVLFTAFGHAASPKVSQLVVNAWDTTTGLPEETIYSVAQTPDGYLWLANANGLVRYDGSGFQTFQPRKDLGGGAKQEINRIGPGPGNSVWVYSTYFGLMQFRGGVFRRAPAYPAPCNVNQILADGDGTLIVCAERVLRIAGEQVTQLTGPGGGFVSSGRDAQGRLWVGLQRGGLARVDDRGGVTDQVRLPEGPVECVLEEGPNRFWACTAGGLALVENGRVRLFTTRDGLPSDRVRRLVRGKDQALWVGTGKGVALGRDGRFEHLAGLPTGSVESIFEDREENVWITSSILSLYRIRKPKFLNWGKPEGLPYDRPRAVVQSGNSVWIGHEGGLSVLAGGRVRHLPYTSVQFLETDAAGRVWGLSENRLIVVDPATEQVSEVPLPTEAKSLRSISRDRQGRMWVVASNGLFMSSGSGMVRVAADGLPSIDARCDVRQSRDGRLWLSMNKAGLFELRDGKAVPVFLGTDPELKRIFTFYIDAHDDFWFGLDGGGLARWRSGKLARYGSEIGKPHNFVYQFAEDTQGYFWLGLRSGLVRVNKTQLNAFLDGRMLQGPAENYYDMDDGLLSFNFGIANRTVASMQPVSELWFVSLRGLVEIDARHVPSNAIVPPVHIQEVSADEHVLPLGPVVTVPAGADNLRFKFSVPTLVARSRLQVRYRLTPLDATWHDSGFRSISYSQVPPGRYTFSVMASNHDGLWNQQGAAIQVEVRPRSYQTWWFRLLAGSSLLLGIFGLFRWRTALLRREKTKLESRVDQRTAELSAAMHVAENAAQAKADFLATMSHEIRTPMHGVLGNLELLSETGLNGQQRDYLDTARNSSTSLLLLLNDILDLSKMEAGRMELHPSAFSLRGTLVEVTQLMQAQANVQGIALSFRYSDALPEYFAGDEMRVRQILFNLLGNAVKFTAEGEVTILVAGLEKDGAWDLSIAVRDTGIGIPPDRLDHLFQEFMQVDPAANRRFGGSGLGLAICQRLAALMDGTITVKSQLGAGSTFTLQVKLAAAAPRMKDSIRPEATVEHRTLEAHVLLAEDNLVNQKLATQILAGLGCRVTVAQNGREAVELALRQSFSLILMDCQMPEMDGYEASRLIRRDLGPEPVIIALTANALPGDRERCFDAGMNDYLTKPFRRADLMHLLHRYLPVAALQK